ncbi:MAG: hypothetical protein APG08_01052 [Candidatus Methanofastidiosum methylothiophilum]|jgi:hypothetical protein|uniref:Uncharacterized protein n=1 Tax=Candidatus Methanofastidiosum methylothiophilum TaxID=1705564 RepID=A0A150JBM2_9EURY|nr:MAG: hypothetical protein AN188_01073 [Candidatus Methanofastidiosum methylthiophilus]MBP6932272.1 hypothetical protein [Methanofastidiosum sp.]OQC50924.1 MAG: hypothetical protein BWX56_01206 [Euryarchaeota archaeon ADurb.Bin023]KYC56301.1 MAG: hypothetical protein APG08_01052 [Candidatus Methanofastidiosum methylthiophilus]KYC58143.1 MAG: hypothetical protein APG09_00647 [Candidatus Methanofastidiosum methylthiophilus]
MGKQSTTKKGQACSTGGCPLCTKEGMILALIGIIVAFLMPPPFGFIGFLIFGLSYFLPSIKKLKLNNSIEK